MIHFLRAYIPLQFFTKTYGGLHRGITLGVSDLTAMGITAMSEFHRLVEHEIPRLRRYARALTRDSNRADDLVQDTLLRGLATLRRKKHVFEKQRKNLAARHRPTKPVGL